MVSQASTTTTLTSSANPSVFGQSVTFTAVVAAVPSGGGTPTGTVNFMDGTHDARHRHTRTPRARPRFSTSSLSIGTHSITAVYAGDTNYTTSTSTAVSQVVNQASTTTTMASEHQPERLRPVRDVHGDGRRRFAGLGHADRNGELPGRHHDARLRHAGRFGDGDLQHQQPGIAGSPHSITAVYAGDTNFATSTSTAVSQTVSQASTTTTVTSDANPSVSGSVGDVHGHGRRHFTRKRHPNRDGRVLRRYHQPRNRNARLRSGHAEHKFSRAGFPFDHRGLLG